ncbi:MAG: hypothetical protein ABSE71_04490 [Candidatus Micrarchaeaceae archaeon]|jgi:hypothetical protein|nr:hypothetical protein [Candidatus Micrarchaeota archaeon]HII10231.1 hypothetical protein [Candidatus Micrarchaeota archaeon]
MATVNKNLLDRRPIAVEDALIYAFSTPKGEKGPRISIARDGKAISYALLRDMSLEDLMPCKITLMGCHLEFVVGEPKLELLRKDYGIPTTYDCIWCGPDMAKTTGHTLEGSGLEILEVMYLKVLTYLSG